MFFLLAGGFTAQGQPGAESLPAVTPVDIDQLMEKVKQDSGNVVLVNAWASWCKPCQEEMPALVKLRKINYNKGFRLIFIAIDDTEIIDRTIRPILKKHAVSFPSYILSRTPDNVFIEKMNSKWSGALPASFIYDRKGTPVTMLVGGKKYQQFADVLQKLLQH